jgi:hypothetical protein
MTHRTASALAVAGLVLGGLGLSAQQKPASPASAGAKPVVSLYKSPT